MQAKGAYVINADDIGHKLIEPGQVAYAELLKHFGTDILFDDSLYIDRKKLAQIVFHDKNKLKILNDVTHKHIVMNIIEQVRKLYDERDLYKYVVIDGALLIEAGLNDIVDELWLIHADTDIKLQRIILRDEITKAQAMSRLDNQLPFYKLKSYADIVIMNNETEDELRKQIEIVLGEG